MRSSQTINPDWTQPDAFASRHSVAVARYLRRQIEDAGGVLPFDQYMDMVLYAPGLGYYATGTRKFGQGGDFVTAPEIGPLFGRSLAREVGLVLETIDDACLLEFGAGSGALAQSLIEALSADGRLPSRYCILEISPDLRERQRQRLEPLAEHHGLKIEWLEQLPDEPLQGVILANEVVDAFAVTRFCVIQGRPWRAGISIDGDGFAWEWIDDLDPDSGAAKIVQQYELVEGYISEVCPRAQAWIHALGVSLQRGLALVIDYGFPAREYYLPERSQGTLRCHYQHRAHNDPLILPGIQDVTCHVNFSALAEAGQTAGFDVLGYTSQESYLLALGLLDLATPQPEDDENVMLSRAAEVKQLILPSQMGEAFKVMALGKNIEQALAGFKLRDRSSSL
ncbi:MAG: class I SAM-dependent methyltransferase [Arenicellales bacterium]